MEAGMALGRAVRLRLARPSLQRLFRSLYRVGLAGMNDGGAGSRATSGDEVPLCLLARRAGPLVVVDGGANVGAYTKAQLAILGERVHVHAFEPGGRAQEQLHTRFGGDARVTLVRAGLADRAGEADFFFDAPGSVHGTLTPSEVALDGRQATLTERVPLVRLDDYAQRAGLATIDLLKLDVEGGELAALEGARGLLTAGRIVMVQFEFGQPSLGARTYFHDVFELLAPGYRLYRLLPHGLAPIERYHESLEVFMGTNYCAVRRGEPTAAA